MAYDIGPRIGIDGEAEFRKSIQAINANIKSLGSEMKLVTAVYEDNEDSMEALSSKYELLEKTYQKQEEHLAQVSKMLEATRGMYDDNSVEVAKWQRVVSESKTALQKTSKEMDGVRKAMDKLGDETDDAEQAFDDLGDAVEKSSGKFDTFKVAAGNLAARGVETIVSGIGSAVNALVSLDEATEEYRVAQGKLQTAFEASGYSLDTAKNAYAELYVILGDTDTATEAAQLMAKLADSEEDFSKWTKIAAGVAGTFGDALPIEGLIEAANETAKVGQVTGALADALNWAGISEDEFNEALARCTDESERNNLIMETLSGTYDEASQAFYRNNEEVIRSRQNQAKLDEVTARLGETVDSVKNAFMERFGPAIADAAEDVAAFIEGIDEQALFDKFDWAFDAIKSVWDGAQPYFDEIGSFLEGAFETLEGVWTGDFQAAADGIGKVVRSIVDTVRQAAHDIANSGLVKGLRDLANTDYSYVPSYGNSTSKEDNTASDYGYVPSYGSQTGSGGDVILDGQKVGVVLRNAGRANGAPMF